MRRSIQIQFDIPPRDKKHTTYGMVRHTSPSQKMYTFGQTGYIPVLKPHTPKPQHKAHAVRYMYGIDDTHICIQNIATRRYAKIRSTDFRPYHQHSDPCMHAPVAFSAKTTQHHKTNPRSTTKVPNGQHTPTRKTKRAQTSTQANNTKHARRTPTTRQIETYKCRIPQRKKPIHDKRKPQRHTKPAKGKTKPSKKTRPRAIPHTLDRTIASPKTLKQARRYPDAPQWAIAHNAEPDQIDSMNAIDWSAQTHPSKKRTIIPTTMKYRYKHGSATTDTTRKARCSVRGDRMKANVHYDPDKIATYMADRTTIRTLFALAASRNMVMEHFDITGAYLHEKYQHKHKVYVWQPKRFDGSYKHTSTHGELKGNLYGTPAAAKIYSRELHRHLRRHGYKQMKADTSLFIKKTRKGIILVGISMDDFLPTASNTAMIDDLYKTLQQKYKVKRLGRPTKYLN